MQDVAIICNRIITPTGITSGIVLIREGKIVDIVKEVPSDNFLVEDAGNNVLMPGVIDPHVHINEPGRTDWEGFDTATKAALAGGVTTLVDMPLNSSPVTITADALKEKISAASGKLHVNCGFWGGIVPGNEDEIEKLVEEGVLGFKAFLIDSGIDEFRSVTARDLRKAMLLIAKHNLPLLVHCELATGNPHRIDNSRSYKSFLYSRPKEWEDDAIALMIRLCREFNCRTHIVHLSSANSIEQISEAKKAGLPLTVETSQHHLYFFAEGIKDGHTEFKCTPPIREQENNFLLHQALAFSIIDFVATDHSPAPPAMKELESGDFIKAWGGISSLQFALPALWTATRQRGALIGEMAKWLCEKPALLAGIQHSKGKIEEGFDADLIVWDPDTAFIVREEVIHHRHKVTPYLGEKLYGVVKQTWLAGKKVYDEGKFLHLNKGRVIYNEK